MADLAEPSTGSGVYRTRDSIQNFKIRIKLWKVTSTLNPEQGEQKIQEEYVFSWQEKLFSPTERGLYEREENCQSALEKKYFRDIQNIKKTGGTFPTKYLFTKVDHDVFIRDREKLTTADEDPLSYIGVKMSGVRRRPCATHKEGESQFEALRFNVVIENPTEEQLEERHLLNPATQSMHIMADLGELVSPASQQEPGEEAPAIASGADEAILCSLHLDEQGVLSLQPDFSHGRPYRAESRHGREWFEYTIEHASAPISRPEQDRELRMLKELYSRHAELMGAMIGNEFEMTLVSYFCHPVEFELLYQKNYVDKQKNVDDLPRWPTLYFEVLSVDSWTRYRTEGYGYIQVPTKPGDHLVQAHCWRPVGNSVVSELRRYFVGGTPELEDSTFVGIPSTFEGKYLGKYGFRTESTGVINFRLSCVQQSKIFLEQNLTRKDARSLMERIGSSAKHIDVVGVISESPIKKFTHLRY